MSEQTKLTRRGGLDWNVPNDGKAADAYVVACTTIYLSQLRPSSDEYGVMGHARRATRLHVISGLLHRLAERQCNEDMTCRECDGVGLLPFTQEGEKVTCRACAGTGETTGRRQKSLEADAQEIAQHYGLECSFGGLVDGGLVIGTPDQLNRVDPERHGHVIRRLS